MVTRSAELFTFEHWHHCSLSPLCARNRHCLTPDHARWPVSPASSRWWLVDPAPLETGAIVVLAGHFSFGPLIVPFLKGTHLAVDCDHI